MIQFISHYGGRTGAPFVLLHLLKWLRANTKLEMRVLVKGDGPLVESFKSIVETAVIDYPPQPNKGLRQLANRLRNRIGPVLPHELPRAWRDLPIDLIYSNTITNGELVNGLFKPGVPVITHVHEMSYWIDKAGSNNLAKVMGHTSRFIAASHATKDNLVGKYRVPANLVDVIHEFIPPSLNAASKGDGIRKQFGIPENAFIIGGSGHESWRKGRDLFVQLASNVHRRLPGTNIHFIWVGYSGDTEDQKRLTHDATLAGVSGFVHWTGEVTDPESYFSEFDLFAMVSREDPFPLVCLEAALQEIPILCFADAGGIPELVEGDAGFIVPYLDLHSMAEKIVGLANDPILASQLGKRARLKVLERHTIDQAGPAVLDIIERELSRARKV